MDLSEVFDADGPLAQKQRNYRYRAQQLAMAECVELACQQNTITLLEAGTGTGKTFAYLVPLLLNKRTAVIATSTKGLQEQLFFRDLPNLCSYLGIERDIRLLKGRANYLCKLQLALLHKPLLTDLQHEYRLVTEYAQTTIDGDIAGCGQVSEHSKIWPLVTSTSDSCSREHCPHFQDCYVYRARKQAMQADIVVANHSVMIADLALRLDQDSQILPNFEVYVFDEAHEIPDTLLEQLARGLEIGAIVKNLAKLTKQAELDDKQLSEYAEVTKKLVKLEQKLLRIDDESDDENLVKDLIDNEKWLIAFEKLTNQLDEIEQYFSTMGQHFAKYQVLVTYVARARTTLEMALEVDANYAWITRTNNGFMIRVTPADYGKLFQTHLLKNSAAIFTSATLAVNNSFDYFCERLQLETLAREIWETPFDLKANSLLLLPKLDDPNKAQPKFDAQVIKLAVKLIKANQGRAFVLFSSYRAMQAAGEQLQQQLDEFDVLIQRSMPADALLREFRNNQARPKVLVGTRTFWQGVDIPGDDLSLVIIDRIPFRSPQDPLLKVIAERYEQQQKDPFSGLQTPQAALILKQAVGRLLRGETDRGLLVICDPRLRTRGYGKTILASLPAMPKTDSVERAIEFLQDN